MTVTFSNQSSGDFTTSTWSFSDGSTSQLVSPTHTYTSEGVYTVKLTASGPGGADTLMRPGYIVVRGTRSYYLPLVRR